MSLDKFKIEEGALNIVGHFDPDAKVEFSQVGDTCSLNIDTEMSGLLIGRHGETLQALEHILRIIISNQVQEFVPLVVDISGYRELRLKEFTEKAKSLAEKVAAYGGTESLPPMNPYERRQIHLLLQDMDGIETASEGEEPERRIVIRPKK